jgi:hypothetical protein
VSLSASIDLDWADGSYHFALLLPQLVELEDKCGTIDASGVRRRKGIIAIYGDLIAGLSVQAGQIVANPLMGSASAYEAREVIRLALLGGGRGVVDGKPVTVDPTMALRLVQAYVDARPIIERWTTAAAILKAAVEGYEPPKAAPAKAPAKRQTRKSQST